MAAEKHFKKLKIFIASPLDVEAERARLASVIESLNHGLADYLGLTSIRDKELLFNLNVQ